jgi:aryl-alcohol dehydrogenase-like predicted oxidoreductase
MDLRTLGRIGLWISPFTIGSMEFGSKVSEAEAIRIVSTALDAGINSVDTANVYAGGRSEEIVGRAIKGRRDSILLASKFSVPTDPADTNSGGTSRRTQLTQQLEALELNIERDLAAVVDEIVPPGGVTVPYYLDDAWADFRPRRFSW